MAILDTYDPVNTLKPVSENLWIVDGPVIQMKYFSLPFTIPFTTRMTIVGLHGRDLWVHSPTPLDKALKAEIMALGSVKYIIGPNRIHYWWLRDWADAFPDAKIFIAPGIEKMTKERLPSSYTFLEERAPSAWNEEMDQTAFAGSFLTEIVFFHKPSKTAILTDLIENFEHDKMHSKFLWCACRLTGCAAPNGKMPIDLRSTFNRKKVRPAAQKIASWPAERVIIAHGQWFEKDGQAELRRALRWAL